MNIQHAILGLLRNKSLTGYDMKKAMQQSPIIYWTGNNSQIYRALADLEEEGWVSVKIEHGEASPTKKVYTITNSGRNELHRLSLGFPEIPEIRKTFLMQLIFGVNLTKPELDQLLEQYRNEVKGVALAVKDEILLDDHTPYERAIRELAIENIRRSYEYELAWIDKVRSVALPLAADPVNVHQKGRDHMKFTRVEKNGQAYIKVVAGQIIEEQDGITMVSACAENDTNKILLPADSLSEEFTNLSTRVAGLVLQKLTNYNVKAAAVVNTKKVRGKFKDFIKEANRGKLFRTFEDVETAEKWLLEED